MALEVIKTIPVGGSPSRVALTPDGGRAYVLNGGGDSVSVISTVTNTVTTTIPVGDLPDSVAISPDGTRAYVTIENAGTVSVISTATNTITANIPVGDFAGGIALTPNGARAYVAAAHSPATSGDVVVIDTATNTVTATIPVDGHPHSVDQPERCAHIRHELGPGRFRVGDQHRHQCGDQDR